MYNLKIIIFMRAKHIYIYAFLDFCFIHVRSAIICPHEDRYTEPKSCFFLPSLCCRRSQNTFFVKLRLSQGAGRGDSLFDDAVLLFLKCFYFFKNISKWLFIFNIYVLKISNLFSKIFLKHKTFFYTHISKVIFLYGCILPYKHS